MNKTIIILFLVFPISLSMIASTCLLLRNKFQKTYEVTTIAPDKIQILIGKIESGEERFSKDRFISYLEKHKALVISENKYLKDLIDVWWSLAILLIILSASQFLFIAYLYFNRGNKLNKTKDVIA